MLAQLAADKGSINAAENNEAIGDDIAVTENMTVIDAAGRLVTPGCIDAHCHIGLHETAISWEGKDVNEKSDW